MKQRDAPHTGGRGGSVDKLNCDDHTEVKPEVKPQGAARDTAVSWDGASEQESAAVGDLIAGKHQRMFVERLQWPLIMKEGKLCTMLMAYMTQVLDLSVLSEAVLETLAETETAAPVWMQSMMQAFADECLVMTAGVCTAMADVRAQNGEWAVAGGMQVLQWNSVMTIGKLEWVLFGCALGEKQYRKINSWKVSVVSEYKCHT